MSTIKTKSISHPSSTDNLTLNSNGSISVGNSTVNTSISTNSTAVSIGGVINYDNSATANSIFVDDSGRVLKPNQTGLFARTTQTTSQNYTSGNVARFYNSVVRDVGNDYDETTGVFTAPVDGFYSVCMQWFEHSGSISRLDIVVNGIGTIVRLGREGSLNFYNGRTANAIVYMDAGDYIEMNRSNGTIHINPSLCHYGIALIG